MARSIAKASLAALTLGLAILSWNRIELRYFLQVVGSDSSRSDDTNVVMTSDNNNATIQELSFSSWKRKHPPGLGHDKGMDDIDIVDSSHEKQKKHENHSSTANATTTTTSHHVVQNQNHSKTNQHSSKDQPLSTSQQESSSSSSSLSPACHPHFKAALPNNGNWTTNVKFKRLYFYHSRKAGGTNLRKYFEKVAAHHGLEYKVDEYIVAKDPGLDYYDNDDGATFYVTNMREPVSRSISHFKYQGRWDCKQLTRNESFIPTEENANIISTWNHLYGHDSHDPSKAKYFRLIQCAVNCYIQWFTGLPGGPKKKKKNKSTMMQQYYGMAEAKIQRYNFVVITEKLGDPKYTAAVDRFFGVPGVANKKNHAYCETESHFANELVPLVITNETLKNLTKLNELDIRLYNDIASCLLDDHRGKEYNFPTWDPNRFERNETIQIDYNLWEEKHLPKGNVNRNKWLKKRGINTTILSDSQSEENQGKDEEVSFEPTSPACEPHFRAALPNGKWTERTKFKRLYFYHARKAGGTNLRNYFMRVAAYHGLEFGVTEYEVAEDPGSHDDATLYVTHMREPVKRSISHFKYEGRWDCKQLASNQSFVPTKENANKLEDWNQRYGHDLASCHKFDKNGMPKFSMMFCAIECYSQWLSGLSCPWWDPPAHPELEERPIRRETSPAKLYKAARAKLLRYNFIVITDKLKYPGYAEAVERFFDTPGISKQEYHPWCEVESHNANKAVPLVVHNETLKNLTRLNFHDIKLYNEMNACLDGGEYDFPKWNPDRFYANKTILEKGVPYLLELMQLHG